jgi:tRNA-specific 2-thiouridylase
MQEIPPEGLDVHARVRSTRAPLPARLVVAGSAVSVDLVDGESGVAPGQACVLYDGDGAGARVLGGGWIDRAERDGAAETALRRIIAPPAAVPA